MLSRAVPTKCAHSSNPFHLLPPAPTPTGQNHLMQEIATSFPSAYMEQPTFHLRICALFSKGAVFGLPGSKWHCQMLFLYFSRVN
jgi:hypothetical protein